MRLTLSTFPGLLAVLVTAGISYAAQSPILVHAGGGAVTDNSSHQTWAPDAGSSNGQTYATSQSISGTPLPALYQSERWNSGALTYNFSVPNGRYSVVLRFAEIYFTQPNQRVFNIAINGVVVKTNFDIVLAAGGPFTAYDLAYPVTVTGGQVVITLSGVIQNPKISALEIIPASGSGSTAYLSPGADIQSYVASYPPGTTFNLSPGTYYNQTIYPKSGDTFIGTAGSTVLSGGRTLTGFAYQNGVWRIGGQTQQGKVLGSCDSTHPACIYPEDLFFDGKPLLRKTSATGLTSGQWYFDYSSQAIIIANNPAGHLVQTSVTQSAFNGIASQVTVENLTVEMYANPAQFGAIGDQYPGPAWMIRNNEVTLNHGPGVRAGSGANVVGNYLHSNGSTGIGGAYASNILVQNNEIAFNNYAGYMHAFECGGGKFAATNGLTVDSNKIHDNLGQGFWTDTDNFNVVYSNNNIYNNQDSGIQHERSFSAKIYGNTLRNNGSYAFTWLWGSQILVQNSQNVEVYNNTVNVSGSYGNGIGLVNQNRGSGAYGAYVLQNNYVHNNDVSYQPGLWAASGIVADYNESSTFNSASNHFDYNSYHHVNPTSSNWIFQFWGLQGLSGFQGYGEEAHGTVDSNIKP